MIIGREPGITTYIRDTIMTHMSKKVERKLLEKLRQLNGAVEQLFPPRKTTLHMRVAAELGLPTVEMLLPAMLCGMPYGYQEIFTIRVGSVHITPNFEYDQKSGLVQIHSWFDGRNRKKKKKR